MISIIIPTYNRGCHLEHLYWKVDKAMTHIDQEYELILVDDASQDDTADIMSKLCKKHQCMKGIILANNVGQQNATLAGIRHASSEIVVTLDDDLRYDPATIGRLLEVYFQGYDVVYGKVKEEKRGKVRKIGTTLKEWLLCILCKKPKDIQLTSYKVMGGPILDYIREDEHEKVYISARILQKTKNITNVEVACGMVHLESTYDFRQLLFIIYNIVRYYGLKPTKHRFKKRKAQYVIKELIK